MFNEFDSLPPELLTADSWQLLDILQRPTLIHMEGEISQPLFISTLLHGDETTGFYALQQLLREYQQRPLPRSISLFIGNVEAAAQKVRRLDNQPDYNRVWPGTPVSRSTASDVMEAVTNIMRARKPFASIDIHNNTGKNPHYACVNVLSAHSLQVASMFADITVYFTNPKGVQSTAFADFCPAVVLECGQATETDNVGLTREYLETILRLDSIPGSHPHNTALYHTVARVTVPERFSLDKLDQPDLLLEAEFEDRNFTQVDAGTVFAHTPNTEAGLTVINENNEDVSDEYFVQQDGALVLQKDVTLSMYTTNTRAVRQDCLCYFMERLHFTS